MCGRLARKFLPLFLQNGNRTLGEQPTYIWEHTAKLASFWRPLSPTLLLHVGSFSSC